MLQKKAPSVTGVPILFHSIVLYSWPRSVSHAFVFTPLTWLLPSCRLVIYYDLFRHTNSAHFGATGTNLRCKLWLSSVFKWHRLSSLTEKNVLFCVTNLFISNALVRVIQLVGEDLAIAREGFLPTQSDRSRCIWCRLHIWGRAWNLNWEANDNRTFNSWVSYVWDRVNWLLKKKK